MDDAIRVLVATDLSQGADEALREGASLLAQAPGVLAIVHVLPRHGEEHSGDMVQGAEHAVREHAMRSAGLAPAEIFIEEGRPEACIVARARQWRADLVIVGGDREPSFRTPRGRVAERVVRAAPCRVLVARASHGHGGVLAATDLSMPALPAVAAGAAEARRRGTSLRVVHAIGFLGVEARYLVGSAASTLSGASDFAGVARELDDAAAGFGVEETSAVLAGSPARAILRDAAAIDAELVVVARHQHRGLRGLLRSGIAERVVRGARCSVLVVKDAEMAQP